MPPSTICVLEASAIGTRSPRADSSGPAIPPSWHRRVTVAHPVWRLESGGLERQLVETLRRLPPPSFRHILIVRGLADPRASLPTGIPDHVRIIREGGPAKDPAWSSRLCTILRDETVDVLHVRGFSMLLDCLTAAERADRVSVGFSFHGLERVSPSWNALRKRVYAAAVSRCEGRWAVSRSAAMAISIELSLDPALFDVFPNGVNTAGFFPSADQNDGRGPLGLPRDRFIVLNVGNLKPIKGHDVLLQAMSLLSSQEPRPLLVFVGQDHLNGELQAWAARQLPADSVRFVGPHEALLPWYQAADLFVLPSRFEGMSNALLEAMACGLPVIATDVGGNAEVIEAGRSGLLVPVDDPTQLARQMERLIADPRLRASLAREGRLHVQRCHDSRQCAAAYGSAYQRLAAAKRGATA